MTGGRRWSARSGPLRVSIALLAAAGCASLRQARALPAGVMRGAFVDDYDNRFEISATRFDQKPHGRFHLVEWHTDSQYVIARNDAANTSDPGAWTRIDWMRLDGMAPYTWAFCFTAWKAPTQAAARAVPAPDRLHPRTGCNGYPFSRMRPQH